jgi:hypothetical protein
MAKQSNLEKIGFERRNENELIRNDIQKNQPYGADHDKAMWHGEEDESHPLGKGTGDGGHQHSVPMEYNEMSRNQIRPQFNTEEGGGSYDIHGRQGVGGRQWLQSISIYNRENQYGLNSVNTEENIADGQYFVK